MSMEQILSALRSFDGVLELAPQPGSEHPEISCCVERRRSTSDD
jgi:hypothetical protein